jgi:ABC-2 type transport system permease protein
MLTAVKGNLKIMFLSIKYNLMKSMENNVAFFTSVIMMIFNNATFIIQWLTIFAVKETIGGYTLDDVMLFWAVSAGAFGLSHIFFNGINRLPNYIEEGKLDVYLTMPKNPLCYVATSSCETSAIGDLIYGFLALIIFNFSIKNLLLYIFLIVCGAFIYASIIVIFNSFTFFFYKFSFVTEAMKNALINSSLYPDVIFSRSIKIIFFTIVPSGLACWIPVHILMEFSWLKLFVLVGSTILFVVLAFVIFHWGLKNYSSSNLMGARA